jgi:hypothetical protein
MKEARFEMKMISFYKDRISFRRGPSEIVLHKEEKPLLYKLLNYYFNFYWDKYSE